MWHLSVNHHLLSVTHCNWSKPPNSVASSTWRAGKENICDICLADFTWRQAVSGCRHRVGQWFRKALSLTCHIITISTDKFVKFWSKDTWCQASTRQNSVRASFLQGASWATSLIVDLSNRVPFIELLYQLLYLVAERKQHLQTFQIPYFYFHFQPWSDSIAAFGYPDISLFVALLSTAV